MNRTGLFPLFVLAALSVSLAVPALAYQYQTERTPSYGDRAPRMPGDYSDYEMTRTFMGKIIEISVEDGFVSIEGKKGERQRFLINGKTKLKADKKTDLADKKDLALTDFQAGHAVKITYWPAGRLATELRLKVEEK